MEQIKIKLNGGIMPRKQHEGDAAYDLYVPEDIEIHYGRQVIDMKFAIELPKGKAAIIQPRSGCSLRGIEVSETQLELGFEPEERSIDADVKIGLIDSNYRKNVGTILQVREPARISSKGMERWYLKKGSRISQMRIVDVPETELVEVRELSESERNGGFGSTGVR